MAYSDSLFSGYLNDKYGSCPISSETSDHEYDDHNVNCTFGCSSDSSSENQHQVTKTVSSEEKAIQIISKDIHRVAKVSNICSNINSSVSKDAINYITKNIVNKFKRNHIDRDAHPKINQNTKHKQIQKNCLTSQSKIRTKINVHPDNHSIPVEQQLNKTFQLNNINLPNNSLIKPFQSESKISAYENDKKIETDAIKLLTQKFELVAAIDMSRQKVGMKLIEYKQNIDNKQEQLSELDQLETKMLSCCDSVKTKCSSVCNKYRARPNFGLDNIKCQLIDIKNTILNLELVKEKIKKVNSFNKLMPYEDKFKRYNLKCQQLISLDNNLTKNVDIKEVQKVLGLLIDVNGLL